MSWPDQPEYNQIFSDNGPVTVCVKFSDKSDSHRSMPPKTMHWHEINRLIDPADDSFFRSMYFDAYRCPVIRYEIDPEKNLLTIIVGKTDLP
ncbi:hypothetical protein [Geomobilimonas luticola]|uniref:Uncharacterized protein n=1 Tax=Geomobilimonas luticola TaxID=1114878 RepID=A0ABS5SAF4_9BACT|nr:hypothetical protein [Geomobilimonas luticola]MBT0652346.1 hypothetical protein [Geomobilimonas luticola]